MRMFERIDDTIERVDVVVERSIILTLVMGLVVAAAAPALAIWLIQQKQVVSVGDKTGIIVGTIILYVLWSILMIVAHIRNRQKRTSDEV